MKMCEVKNESGVRICFLDFVPAVGDKVIHIMMPGHYIVKHIQIHCNNETSHPVAICVHQNGMMGVVL